MTDIAFPAVSTLRDMTVEDLRAELARSLTVTARHLSHLAAIWRELERRGEDLSDLRTGLWTFMPLIARGALRAELVVKYAGYAMLLRRLAALPPEEQDRLLADDRVPVASLDKEGRVIEQTLAVSELKAAQLPAVIHKRIVPIEEQRKKLLQTTKVAPTESLSRRDIVLRAAKYRRTDEGGELTVTLRLSPYERDRLQQHAADASVDVARIVIAALDRAGVLER